MGNSLRNRILGEESFAIQGNVGKNESSNKDVVNMFVQWIRTIATGRKCVVISDNMIYDGGLLKYYSDVDVIYLLGGYTVYFETSSVYYGMSCLNKRTKLCYDTRDESSKKLALEAVNANKTTKVEFPSDGVKHDHHPENDAENMANKWCFIMNNI